MLTTLVKNDPLGGVKYEEKYMILSTSLAANKVDRTKASIYYNIRRGRLVSKKVQGRWTISDKDLQHYLDTKYSRRFSLYEGKPLFDKGEISVKEASEVLNCSIQHLYYVMRQGKIPFYRKGYTYVLLEKDIGTYVRKPKKVFLDDKKPPKPKLRVLRKIEQFQFNFCNNPDTEVYMRK